VVPATTPCSPSLNAWLARPRHASSRHIMSLTTLRALRRVPSYADVRAHLTTTRAPATVAPSIRSKLALSPSSATAEVKYWIRNLSKKPSSFRLQTSKDRFYPDFICQLTDRRILVVEYKGQHLFTDAEEKRAVGEVWASRSNGKCRFVMPTEGDFTSIVRAVIS
jgi:hypothetical protein